MIGYWAGAAGSWLILRLAHWSWGVLVNSARWMIKAKDLRRLRFDSNQPDCVKNRRGRYNALPDREQTASALWESLREDDTIIRLWKRVKSSSGTISKIEEWTMVRSFWSGQHMAFLAGSWRPAGWAGLSPASPKKRRVCQKRTAETGGTRMR